MKIPLHDILERLTGINKASSKAEVERAIKRLEDYIEQNGDTPLHFDRMVEDEGEYPDKLVPTPGLDKYIPGMLERMNTFIKEKNAPSAVPQEEK